MYRSVLRRCSQWWFAWLTNQTLHAADSSTIWVFSFLLATALISMEGCCIFIIKSVLSFNYFYTHHVALSVMSVFISRYNAHPTVGKVYSFIPNMFLFLYCLVRYSRMHTAWWVYCNYSVYCGPGVCAVNVETLKVSFGCTAADPSLFRRLVIGILWETNVFLFIISSHTKSLVKILPSS